MRSSHQSRSRGSPPCNTCAIPHLEFVADAWGSLEGGAVATEVALEKAAAWVVGLADGKRL